MALHRNEMSSLNFNFNQIQYDKQYIKNSSKPIHENIVKIEVAPSFQWISFPLCVWRQSMGFQIMPKTISGWIT